MSQYLYSLLITLSQGRENRRSKWLSRKSSWQRSSSEHSGSVLSGPRQVCKYTFTRGLNWIYLGHFFRVLNGYCACYFSNRHSSKSRTHGASVSVQWNNSPVALWSTFFVLIFMIPFHGPKVSRFGVHLLFLKWQFRSPLVCFILLLANISTVQ